MEHHTWFTFVCKRADSAYAWVCVLMSMHCSIDNLQSGSFNFQHTDSYRQPVHEIVRCAAAQDKKHRSVESHFGQQARKNWQKNETLALRNYSWTNTPANASTFFRIWRNMLHKALPIISLAVARLSGCQQKGLFFQSESRSAAMR